MKSILLAFLLASVSAHAADSQGEFFQCEVKPGEAIPFGKAIADAKSSSAKDKSKENTDAQMTMSKFIDEQVMPSIIVSALNFNQPAIFEFNQITTNSGANFLKVNASFDVSTRLNFRSDLAYHLQSSPSPKTESNPLAMSVDIADKNSQLDISVRTPTQQSTDPEIQEVELKNAQIIQEMGSKLGAQMSPVSYFPKLNAKVLFSEKNSSKSMTLRLQNAKNQSLVGVELRQISGAISVTQVNGFFTLVYSFASKFGISASINPKDANQKLDDSNLQASGVYIVGVNPEDPASIAKLKDLKNKVCSTNKVRLYVPSNMTSTIQSLKRQ